RERAPGLSAKVGSGRCAAAVHAELARDVEIPPHADGLGAERGSRHPGRRREGRFDLGRYGAPRRELAAEARFLPAHLVLAALAFIRLVFALAPFLVCLDLIAAQETAESVFEAVLPVLQELAEILQLLDVERRGRAIAAVESLAHLGERVLRAVALGARRDHERVVDLRVALGLLRREAERRARERAIERARQLHARKCRRGRPILSDAASATLPSLPPCRMSA